MHSSDIQSNTSAKCELGIQTCADAYDRHYAPPSYLRRDVFQPHLARISKIAGYCQRATQPTLSETAAVARAVTGRILAEKHRYLVAEVLRNQKPRLWHSCCMSDTVGPRHFEISGTACTAGISVRQHKERGIP